MTARESLILYDLGREPDSDGKCSSWSFNVWKARLVLNYKKIEYSTEWVNHVNLAEKLKAAGFAPDVASNISTQSGAQYTVPAVVFTDGIAMRESADIARKLDELYPEPRLLFDDSLEEETQKVIGAVTEPLLPEYMYRIGHHILCEETREYWLKEREARFGMSMEKFKEVNGGEQVWKGAEPGFQMMERLLTEHKKDQGPFILGSQVSYSDCMVAALAESIRRIAPEVFERCRAYGSSFEKLRNAFEEKGWMQKDD